MAIPLPTRILAGLAAAAGALALAAPAHAGNGAVTREGTTIKVDFGTTESTDSLVVNTPTDEKITLRNSRVDGTMTTAASGCTPAADGREVTCTVSGAQRLLVELGPGTDFTEFQTYTAAAVQVEVHGGAGNDFQLRGTDHDDIVDGGAGDDKLDTRAGDDVLIGGPGDDDLSGGNETDDIRGGPGFDLVRFDFATTGVAVSLDDAANDGMPGEGANVHSDVEDVEGTSDADVITGSAAGNVIEGRGGDDRIDGRGGSDRIRGGDGADTVAGRDGLAELIDCGAGADALVADDVDVADGCEAVQRSAAQQTDVDRDGAARPADCDDRDPRRRPGAAEVVGDGIDQDCDGRDAIDRDRDRDGVPAPIDCDDLDPTAHPGARELRGNRVDEDCNGRSEPLLTVENGVPNAWSARGAITRNLALGVRDVVPGMTVELRCRGGGCPFKRKARAVERGRRLLDLHPLLRDARLRSGAVLEVRVQRPEAVGKVIRYRVRNGIVPRSRKLCLVPGAKRPGSC